LSKDDLAEKRILSQKLNTNLQKMVLDAYEEIADFIVK
jgi:hypothetical protein